MSTRKGCGRLGEKLPHLTEAEAIAFKAEIRAYMARTNTKPARLSIWARGYAAAIYIMMKNPIPTKAVAEHFRAAMAEYPNGAQTSRRKSSASARQKGAHETRLSDAKLEGMRAQKREARAAHVAACRQAHVERYGADAVFGKRLRDMRA